VEGDGIASVHGYLSDEEVTALKERCEAAGVECHVEEEEFPVGLEAVLDEIRTSGAFWMGGEERGANSRAAAQNPMKQYWPTRQRRRRSPGFVANFFVRDSGAYFADRAGMKAGPIVISRGSSRGLEMPGEMCSQIGRFEILINITLAMSDR
jgi:hypothetical protein